MKPTRSILDPEFRYVTAVNTDIRKTFAKYRRELARREVQLPQPRTVIALLPRERKAK